MYREPARVESKAMKVVLSYEEVRNICLKHLIEQGRIPKKEDRELAALIPGDSNKYSWSSTVLNHGSGYKANDDMLSFEFRVKTPV